MTDKGARISQDVEPEPTWRFILLRIGLIGTGVVVLQTAALLWFLAESFRQPLSMALSAAAWIFGMICFVLAMLTRVPQKAQWVILVGLVGAFWCSAYIEQLNYTPLSVSHSDSEMVSEYAAEALRHGNNPYIWNFSDHTRVFRDRGFHVTTFLNSTAQNRVSYPALPTLNLLAFGLFGMGSVREVNLIFHTLMLVLIFMGTPYKLRPIILLPFFVVRSFILISLGGIQDIVWSTLLVAMVLSWKRPTLRGVLFGLACAYRQQPWFVAPFLLIYLWYEKAEISREERKQVSSPLDIIRNPRLATTDPRLRKIFYFSTVSFVIFLLINLPFILWDMQAWVLGVFEHMYAAFNIYSHGLGALSQYNLVSFPREFYTSLQLSSLAIMLIIHRRHPRSVGQAFWVFPGIFFFLYYRGLANYWLYWIPPLLIAVTRTRWQAPIRKEPNTRWRWTTNLVVAVLAGNLLWGIFMLQHQPAIIVSLHYPIESPISRLDLTVNNTTDQILHPRFALQLHGNQPLPWGIIKGPERLKPGETGYYIIQAPSLSYTPLPANGAQVVISDASNDYKLRAVINLPNDATFNNPDAIVNPAYTFWWSYQQNPARWLWNASEGEVIPPRLEKIDGQSALVLSVEGGVGRLSQSVTFPDQFSIWVRPATLVPDPPQEAYGLEIVDKKHRLWVLFGDREGSYLIEQGFGVVYLRTPLNQWSQQSIDPAELYSRFGWELPAYSLRNRQGIEFAARQVSFSLLVSGTQVSGVFGPIEQDTDFASPHNLIAEAIAHPDIYYVNMGKEYYRQRNFDLAAEAYQHALEYNPKNIEAQQSLEELR